MKRQRDERLEAAGLVLQRAGAQHVIDALLVRLDVAVQHRDVRLHAEAVRDAMNRQPSIGVGLVVADLPPYALGKHLRAAAGQRRESRIHQLAQHLLVGHAVEIGEERDLDGGKALQMNLGPDALEASQQLQVVLERQIGMQTVDDVNFGERLIAAARAASPTRLPATSCRNRDRRDAAARTSRTGSSPRRRSSPRCGCCSCSRSDRRGAARARDWRALPLRAGRDARTAAPRPRASAARGARAFRQYPAETPP